MLYVGVRDVDGRARIAGRTDPRRRTGHAKGPDLAVRALRGPVVLSRRS